MRRAWRDLKRLLKARSFLALSELPAYRRLLSGDERALVGLRVRPLGGRTVFARPGTADPATLCDVFRYQYHLPPTELPEAPVILDLGCNCGYTVVHYKHLHPDARVLGVELDEDNLAVARRNVEGLRDVEVVHAAVSDRDGFVSYDKRAAADAFRVATLLAGASVPVTTVRALSPPSLLRRYGLSRVDFAKIDIEGEEVKILDAAADLDWLDAVHSLNVEVHGGRAVCDELLATLERHGFSAWKDDHHWSAIKAVKRGAAAARGSPAPGRGSP